MAKYLPKTKVIIGGIDVGRAIVDVTLPRRPGDIECVELELAVSRLEIDESGTLVIHVLESLGGQ